FCPASAPSEIYTLSLHDALPIFQRVAAVLLAVHVALEIGQRSLSIRVTDGQHAAADAAVSGAAVAVTGLHSHRRSGAEAPLTARSEEHTSELQSRENLVCRLLLE